MHSTFIVSYLLFLQGDQIETRKNKYEVSSTAIKDKSMLSHHAQKLCENTDAHWMTPTCNAAADSNERKFSRRLSVCTIQRRRQLATAWWGH